MERTLFNNKCSSYLLISLAGVSAGLLVAFFSRFPSDDLWSLALFSSMTFGFWMFTSSLIALYSSKNYVAGAHVALYVYFMFYVTGIFKRLTVVNNGYNTFDYFLNGLWQELAYGLPAAVGCFALAFLLWYGRKNKPISVVLRFAPLLFILAEAVTLWIVVFNRGQALFMAVIDTVCAAAYLLIILRSSHLKSSS